MLRGFRADRFRVRKPDGNSPLTLNESPPGVTVRGQTVRLSPREYQLLDLFLRYPGKVLTHAFILRHVWGNEVDVQYVRVYIRALRQKIELDPDHPTLMVTQSGVGYRLDLGNA